MPYPETGKDLYEQTHGTQMLIMAPGLITLEIVPFQVAAYNKKKRQMHYCDTEHHEDFECSLKNTNAKTLPKKARNLLKVSWLLRPGLC